jgi:hypothetical protein
MAKNKQTKQTHEDETLLEVSQHYQDWTEDNDKRALRKNGWNDVTDAYWGELPKDWPYQSRVVDPRIRTSIIEKDARLLNNKLRGRLVPREGGDILSARVNNSVLDFQWENANHGGSMETKMLISSQDARLYGSKFAFVTWKTEKDKDGKLIFDGNELEPLDIRDCGMDAGATHIKDAKWFQHRKWWYIEDLEAYNETVGKESRFQFTEELKRLMKDRSYQHSDKKSTERLSRVKQLKGLEDRLGEDRAFPVVELVTEYRKDRWITFSPHYKLVLRDIDNPFDHGRIPIAQLRYYPLQDDPIGESEVEPVISLWKAIQAVVCGYLDEMNIKMRPPIKIIEGAARIETIVYGPEAQWLVSRQDAVEEMRASGDAQRWFQTTYSALVSAFNIAMGDMSQASSSVDPFNRDKTATEINQTVRQQQTRDQRNQNELAEFIHDIMGMWLENNKQFLFSDERKHEYVLRIIGTEAYNYFKRSGLDDMVLPDESMQAIVDIIELQGGDIDDIELENLIEAGKVPRHPVQVNLEEKDPEKILLKPKMRVSELNDTAELSVVPQDLRGSYDYVADVKSMAIGADQELQAARLQAVEMLTSNQMILGQLQQEGYQVNIKELLTNTLEDLGLKDAERYFERMEQQTDEQQTGQSQEAGQGPGGPAQNIPEPGLPGVPQADTGGSSAIEQMAQPKGI